MTHLKDFFIIEVSRDRMTATLHITEELEEQKEQLTLSKKMIEEFLSERKIIYGVIEENIEKIVSNFSTSLFPLTIAEGKRPVDGDDGYIDYHIELSPEIDRSEGWDFREVMKIPIVKKGEKLATKYEATKGIDGKNVYGREVRARPGKPIVMNPGKNVDFNKDDQSFYATAIGQIQVLERFIHVHTVYELNEDVSMKTGNIDFSGSVIIRGDVPTGFTVKATGDITIYGLVEAATIEAGGSVTVSEGLAGLTTGSIKAGEDVKISYINQGNVIAGDSLFVENSILHSEIVVKNNIFCQRGNIIGGSLSAGQSIEARDIGNRMNTMTHLSFGIDRAENENIEDLTEKQKELEDNLRKLNLLKKRLSKNKEELTSKERITLLRLERSRINTKEQLEKIDDQLEQSGATLGDIKKAYLKVRGTLFPNVVIAFGRYKRRIDKNYDYVRVRMIENEIEIDVV